ncbi:MAG TPA: family 10 glycosylhydrolase [Chryseosolibacter sp.]
MKHVVTVTATLLLVVISFSSVAQQWPKRELRAAWIATVANIDWPSQKGLSVSKQQQEYVTLLDTLQRIGMNAVVVQVRPVADAFYPSSYEPWSEYFSGKQGQPSQPYYNPLTFMIREARQRGLEFHAWFNPYRASMNATLDYADNHPIRQHPEWFLSYGGKYYYDPGHPEAQEYVLKSIMETVKHYDLDAVHFDDYFYPYRIANVEFPDSCSYQAYGANVYPEKDDWRRSNVDYFVQELSKRIKMEKPHLKFGISPFGVWRNIDKDPLGSATRAGQTNYDDLYADVLKWLREGWIDYVTPQLYWHIGFEVADYRILADWWSKHTYGKHLYIGQGAYRIGGKGWEDPDELFNQVNLNREYSGIGGSMYFSSKVFLQNKDSINSRMGKIYPYRSLVPVMDWLPSQKPARPLLLSVTGTQQEGVVLNWKDTVSSVSDYYVVYRFSHDGPRNLEDATRIVAIVPRTAYAMQTWTDGHTKRHSRYSYIVTGVGRLHHESEGSNEIVIRTRGKRGEVRTGE